MIPATTSQPEKKKITTRKIKQINKKKHSAKELSITYLQNKVEEIEVLGSTENWQILNDEKFDQQRRVFGLHFCFSQ